MLLERLLIFKELVKQFNEMKGQYSRKSVVYLRLNLSTPTVSKAFFLLKYLPILPLYRDKHLCFFCVLCTSKYIDIYVFI